MSATSCWYGTSYTRKTTQLGLAAVYQYETTGNPSRMIFADNASVEHIQDIIDAGFIDFRRIDTSNHPRSLIKALLAGDWWPMWKDQAGVLKLTPAGYALVQDSAGVRPIPLRDLASQGPNGQVHGVNDLSKVGGYICETLSSIGDIMLRNMGEEQRLLGEQKSTVYSEPSFRSGKPEEWNAPSSLMQYGSVQNTVLGFLNQATQLPVPRFFWTSHEAKGKDEFSGETTLGPGVVGKAITSKIPRNMGDLFHFEMEEEQTVVKNAQGQDVPALRKVVKAFYLSHQDKETGLFWPAGPRISAITPWGTEDKEAEKTNMEKLRTRFPGGFIDLNRESLVDYLRFKDTELVRQTDRWKKYREEVDKRHDEVRKAREKLVAQAAQVSTSPKEKAS